MRTPQRRNELWYRKAIKWLDVAKIFVYYEYLLLIPFNAGDDELPAVLEPRSLYHTRLILGVQ